MTSLPVELIKKIDDHTAGCRLSVSPDYWNQRRQLAAGPSGMAWAMRRFGRPGLAPRNRCSFHAAPARLGRQDDRKKKAAGDQARSKRNAKLVRSIMRYAQEAVGRGDDPQQCSAVAGAAQAAIRGGVPRTNVDKAIKASMDKSNSALLERIIFEGTLGEFCFVVEALTDNRKRAVQEIRHGFTANGGSLGTSGSVMWAFDERGTVTIAPKSEQNLDDGAAVLPREEFFDILFEEALEAGALDVEQLDDSISTNANSASHSVICSPSDLSSVTTAVRDAASSEGYQVLSSEFTYIPKSTIVINEQDEAADKFDSIHEALDGCDDVQTVFHNVEFERNGD